MPRSWISCLLVLVTTASSLIEARPMLESPVRRAYSVDDPSLPAAVRTICDGGVNATTVLSSTELLFNGTVGHLTTGTCTLPQVGQASSGPSGGDGLRAPSCPTARNNCAIRFGNNGFDSNAVSKCGAPCTSSCYSGNPGGGPDPNDCEYAIGLLFARNPQLFTLPTGGYNLFTWRSCGIGIQNQIVSSGAPCTQRMQYDYADVANVARYLAWNCQAAQNAHGGRCTADSGVYVPNFPDFYIQVYRNQ
ncbi:SubName: Full=Uncharacterized protein {ECO:0000313/EMBL:CCA72953.1} [Serendipita indica DSM 11827]|nr:SubName: Full=Uncharacterized protein {ECO:0000313/EMBL:CCA72953.1} [Serendipita indica DSM 11827]